MSKYLEQQLFDWNCKEWDKNDPGDFLFSDVTLKVDIGKYKAGHKFVSACFSMRTSVVEFYSEDGKEVLLTADLKITAVPRE